MRDGSADREPREVTDVYGLDALGRQHDITGKARQAAEGAAELTERGLRGQNRMLEKR